MEEGIYWEFGTDIYPLLCTEYITNMDLLCSTGNSAQYSVTTQMGKESEKGGICVYVWLIHLMLYTNYTPI